MTLLEDCRANSQLKRSIEKPGFGNLLYFTFQDLLLAEKNYRFRKSKFMNFDRFFRNFLNFLKNYPTKSEVKISIERSSCENFSCRNDYSKFFVRDVRSLGKQNFLSSHLF